MNIVRRFYPLIFFFLLFVTVTNLVLPPDNCEAASQRTLAWSVVDTPSDGLKGMFINTYGINDLALGPDNKTFYAVSTQNTITGLFKSTDAGYTWSSNIGNNLASFPVWNVAVAPDDVNFIIAITGGLGPMMAFYSIDGGNNWTYADLTLTTEYISCLDISISVSGTRDIAIGTRTDNDVAGRLLTRRYSTSFAGAWLPQPLPDATTTAVTSVKFSPNYPTDQTLAIVSFPLGLAGGALHLGKYPIPPNTIQWDVTGGYPATYPVRLGNTLVPPIRYQAGSIVRTGIQLPSDYTAGSDMSLSGCFVNVDNITHSRVFYVSPTPTVFNITPTGQRIYSIAYTGTNATGILLAGAATGDPTRAMANVWQSSNAQATCSGCATWLKSDSLKSPTGGGGTGRANVLLGWSSDGSRAYCGTSSENSTLGGTGLLAGQWPFSKLTKVPSDESAFQYSVDNGFAWNQIGIINTIISRLSDVAAYEQAEGASSGTLYLASLNDNVTRFDSVWRSISDPLGLTWERVLTAPHTNNDAILRVNPWDTTSQVIVFADLGTENITYSADGGDTWAAVLAGIRVKDLTLPDNNNIYVLSDYSVRKLSGSGSAWTPGKIINTNLLAPGHTLCTPGGSSSSIVFVGTEGNSDTGVAWVDFSEFFPKFTALKELPMQGNVHVAVDDQYASNKNVYAGIGGIGNVTNTDGTIYRWTMEGGADRDSLQTSINWDPLEPPDSGYYGICMLNNVLYGAWNADTPNNSSGADRTLEARVRVPPPPQWDQLIDGLPPLSSLNPVEFTREPTSLHLSSNTYNTLWAIDDRPYNFIANQGCLWQYIDSVAKLGPWPTAPPPGGFIGPDPSTGRAQQIDFRWRPLKDIFGYDVLIAKDVNFTLLLSQTLRLTPVDNLTGAWVVTPADQENPSCWISPGVLEVGRSYYWRVRGSRSLSGTPIHSPWSPTLFFSIKPGFRVTADYLGPTLLTPLDGICSNCKPPIRFSWSPVKNTTAYEFILAKNAQLTDVIVQEKTKSTAFELKSKLQPATPYYWQVRAVAPIPSDPSPVGAFSLTEDKTTPQKPPATTTKPGGVKAPSDFWIWIIIVIVVVLLLLINAYVFISRRRDE